MKTASVYFACILLASAFSQVWAGSFYGLCYTPFRAFGVCPTDAEVEADVAILLRHTTRVRIYSTECRNVNKILLKHSSMGRMSVLFGVYLDNRPTDQQEVDYLIEALQAYPNAKIEGVVVGNEVMYRNTLHKQTLIQRIHEVRGKVRAVGYATGNPSYQTAPVYAVEIFPIPEIGGASDMLGLNIHPFYRPDLQNHPDPEIMSDRILKAAVEQIELYQSLMPNKPIIVTEIGWPTHSDASELHRGDPIVALKFMKKFTAYSQQKAIHFYYFELFDSPWKKAMFPSNQNTMSEFNFGVYQADRVTMKQLPVGCSGCGHAEPSSYGSPVSTHEVSQASSAEAYAHSEATAHGQGAAFSEAVAQAHASNQQGHASADAHSVAVVHGPGHAISDSVAEVHVPGTQHFFPPADAIAKPGQPYRKMMRL